MKKSSLSRDQSKKKITSKLTPIERKRWNNTYHLLRTRTDATEEEAIAFASTKVRVLAEIRHELAYAN